MTSKMNLVESYAHSSHYLLRWHPREEALTDFCICDLILYSEFVAIIKKQLDQLVNQNFAFLFNSFFNLTYQ